MNLAKIEEQIQQLSDAFTQEAFIYDLLAIYGKPKASITRLQKGTLNLSKQPDEIIWKKNLYFKHTPKGSDLHGIITSLRNHDDVIRHALRFVVVTDYDTLLAVDTKTGETLDTPIAELARYFDFFLPWAGQEKTKAHNESQADIKAAYKMARLYDEICKDNQEHFQLSDPVKRHSLNVFLSRLLFCFFAEDTEIFPTEGMFTSAVASHTQEDGNDLQAYLERLFAVLNMPPQGASASLHYLGTMLEPLNENPRDSLPVYLQAFPYVNGGLFSESHPVPAFSRRSRWLIIECGELDWSEINPDIFGSMIQAVVHPDQRGGMGMHYTSVTNIMKVIEPLFLNDLKESFEQAQDSPRKLEALLERLLHLKLFDPACGSGNFLIIAYKELRTLEMQIYARLQVLNAQQKLPIPKIKLTQFYGIELDDFAHEIAMLSLWLAEHQMNVKFKKAFGQVPPPLPLKAGGNIVCDNATRRDWETVCPKKPTDEIYILGNPPYLGSSNQDDVQKADMAMTFQGVQNYKNLDYIACWFFRGASYIQGSKAQLAFVSTNSICQGEQVEMLWPHIFHKNLEIGFAHRSFKWQNNAKHNAGVTVVIIGLRNTHNSPKNLLYGNGLKAAVENITPYLSVGKNIVVEKRGNIISILPAMSYGSKAVDDGNLILSKEERASLINQHPNAEQFIKKLVGSDEFINGKDRWCIWVTENNLTEALSIKPFPERFDKVRKFREASKKEATQESAITPWRFGEPRYSKSSSILVPRVSSERREYLPFGFLDENTVIVDSAQAIYDPEPWVFAVISSKLHNVWVRAVAGRLRTDIRYSSVLCYNTFPFPPISQRQKDALAAHVFNVLSEREKHPEKTIAQLYDPDKMPAGLLQAHRDLDASIERLYRSRPFTSDEERLEHLFKLYEEMIEAEKQAKAKPSVRVAR